MSLFGAKKQLNLKESLKNAKENLEGKMSSAQSTVTTSSGIGAILEQQLNKITGPVTVSDNDGATVSEVAREEREFFGTAEYERLKAEEKNDEFEYGLHKARIEDDLRRREQSQATSRVESGQLPSDLDEMRAYSDLTGRTGVTGVTRYGSDDSSELSPPPPTTDYGGSKVSFPLQTPRERVQSPLPSTNYEGSLIVTAQAGTVIPGNNRRKIRVVRMELCYGKAETLEDVEEAARWWRYNLVR